MPLKTPSPSLKRALAAITALLGATAVRDVRRGGNLQQLLGRSTPSSKAVRAALDASPRESTRLAVAKENPLGSLLPAGVAHRAGRLPMSVATNEAQLARRIQRIQKVTRAEALERASHYRDAFEDHSAWMMPLLSRRLPAPPEGGAYLEAIIGGHPRLPRALVQHEIGHIADLSRGGPNADWLTRGIQQGPTRRRLEALAETLFGPLHSRRTMAMERAAWDNVPASAHGDALRAAGLGSYESTFHTARAKGTAPLAALSAALLGGTMLKDRRDAAREAEMEDHEKLGFDPLTAGTLGVMLPAAILRALGTSGYAGRLSRGAGWRRPVVAATDAAVNRAAEGIGDLAMGTAGLNWSIRKGLAAAARDPADEDLAMDGQEELMPFLAGFDDELSKSAGLQDQLAVLGIVGGRKAGRFLTKVRGREAARQNVWKQIAEGTTPPTPELGTAADSLRGLASIFFKKGASADLAKTSGIGGRLAKRFVPVADQPLETIAGPVLDGSANVPKLMKALAQLLRSPGARSEARTHYKGFIKAPGKYTHLRSTLPVGNPLDLPKVEQLGLISRFVKDPLAREEAAEAGRKILDGVKLSSAAFEDELAKLGAVRVGPPPKNNRKQHPYTGTVQFQDLPEILIENLKGSVRSGTGPGGVKWSTEMPTHYGEFRGTMGTDGDALDVYVGPDATSTNVYIVHIKKPPTFRVFDEDKVCVGFGSAAEVTEVMNKAYDDKRFVGSISSCSITDLQKVLAKRSARGEKLDQTVMMAKAAGSLWTGFSDEMIHLGAPAGAPRGLLFVAAGI